ncbi:hypothetical protein [Actinomyces gaoshouyii]|nr:hypothetical protein [Actinomyces gaoshouyii]
MPVNGGAVAFLVAVRVPATAVEAPRAERAPGAIENAVADI